MKKYFLFVCSVASLALLYGCKKQFSGVKPTNLSSVTLVNTITASNPVVPDFSPVQVQWFSNAQNVGPGAYFEYTVPSGVNLLSIWALTDTLNTIFKGNINFQPQAIYSLYLVGLNPANPDTVLVQDKLPYYKVNDSVAGIRFANMSPGSNAVSVDIQGLANGSEVSNLPYKELTGFKPYQDTNENPASGQYTFEFRDAASGTLLAQYTYSNLARFNNVTIALFGAPGSQSVMQINDH